MADLPFDRVNFGLREAPVSDDRNRVQSQAHRSLAYLVGRVLGARSSDISEALALRDACHGNDLRCAASSPAAMTVVVGAGLGWQYLASDLPQNIGAPDLSGVDDLDPYKPIVLLQPHTFAVPTAPSALSSSRTDIIEVKASRLLTDSTTRRQLNESTGGFDPHDFYKTLSYAVDGRVGTVTSPADSTEPLSYKVGVEGFPGAVPATSPGYVKLAEVIVNEDVVNIAANMVVDRRKILGPGGVVTASMRFRYQWNGGAGAQIITMLSVTAPPGVQCAAKAFVERTEVGAYFLGGHFTRASVRVGMQPYSHNELSTQAFIAMHRGISVFGTVIESCSSGTQTTLAVATPPIQAAIGSQLVGINLKSRYIANAGVVNDTDTELEDIVYDVAVDLAYT